MRATICRLFSLVPCVILACSGSDSAAVEEVQEGDSRGSEVSDLAGNVDLLPGVDLVDSADVAEPADLVAVPGQRCSQGNRIGTVAVMRNSWGPTVDVWASIADRPAIVGNEATLSDDACTFFQQESPGFCEPGCAWDESCDASGSCVPQPVPATDVVLTLEGGGDSQVFAPRAGSTWGTLELQGDSFSAEVKWGKYTVTLEDTPVADLLADLSVALEGSDRPDGLAISWTPAPTGALVFTHIPINHHAGGPTYTECAVDAAVGSMHVPGEMLKPLAVSTGLEFQGVDHVRFAAAQTPDGCVEFRFGASQQVSPM